MWAELAEEFLQAQQLTGGLVIRYEDLLSDPEVWVQIRDYTTLDLPSVDSMAMIPGRTRRPVQRQDPRYLPKLDRWILHRQVKRAARRYGYA
jgi:hypothetical protein